MYVLAAFHFVMGAALSYAVLYLDLPAFVNPGLAGFMLMYVFVQSKNSKQAADPSREEMLRDLIDRLIVQKNESDRKLLLLEKRFRRRSVF